MGRVRTFSQTVTCLSAAVTVLAAVLSIMAAVYGKRLDNNALSSLALNVFIIFLVCLVITIAIIAIQNKFTKGMRYGWRYFTIRVALEHELLNAGIYDLSKGGYAILPKTIIRFSDDMAEATVTVRSSLEFADRLSKIDISPGIGSYVQESVPTLSTSKNEYIFSLYDSNQQSQMEFNTYKEFKATTDSIGDYKLMLDKRYTIPFQHILVVGHTGTGKTYAIINLILQMINKTTKVHLYVVDPKASSTYSFAKLVKAEQAEYDFDSIVETLKRFDELLEERKLATLDLFPEYGINADYRDMHLEPYYLIFDEYAAFNAVLQTKPKAQRDEVNQYIHDVILLGRQLGFFMIIAMQKSDATTLSTALRDSMTTKIVLGNAEDTTYVTAFGAGVTIPKHHFEIGEGVCTISGITDSPIIIRVPSLNFDLNRVSGS